MTLYEFYIEALLVDEELADQVWEGSIVENLTDGAACMAWLLIAESAHYRASLPSQIRDYAPDNEINRGDSDSNG